MSSLPTRPSAPNYGAWLLVAQPQSPTAGERGNVPHSDSDRHGRPVCFSFERILRDRLLAPWTMHVVVSAPMPWLALIA
eukprot:5811746-Prymnesium_polylepis.1